jgi:hypothetical protein
MTVHRVHCASAGAFHSHVELWRRDKPGGGTDCAMPEEIINDA